jgi:ankyrin repeat protein
MSSVDEKDLFLSACKKDDTTTLQQLLEQKADANLTDGNGENLALIAACESGKMETIVFLIEKVGVKMVSFKKAFDTLFQSLYNRHCFKTIGILYYLEKKGLQLDLNAIVEPQFGDTFFMFLCVHSDKEFVKYAVETYGVHVNGENNVGKTALYHAAMKGRFEVVKYLIEELGADMNTVNNNGRTILSCLCVSSSPSFEVIQCLVENRADLEIEDRKGKTAIMYATEHGRYEIVKYFMKAGAVMTKVDGDGNTLLVSAAYRGYTEVVQFLIENTKIDIDAKNKKGHTALTECIGEPFYHISGAAPRCVDLVGTVRYLVDKGIYIDKDFLFSRHGNEDGVLRKAATDCLKKALFGEISQAFFVNLYSPFSKLDFSSGTFGHYVVQTVIGYTVPDADNLWKLPGDEKDRFFLQICSRQHRSKIGFLSENIPQQKRK